MEYRLKPGETATPEELAQVEALPKPVRVELDELKAKFAEIPKVTLCTRLGIVQSIDPTKVKPSTIVVNQSGNDYSFECYVSESVKDQYLQGDITVGDYVLVEFIDDDADKAVIFAKVYKSW